MKGVRLVDEQYVYGLCDVCHKRHYVAKQVWETVKLGTIIKTLNPCVDRPVFSFGG